MKIDLRQRYELSEFPPQVAELIEKCGGLSKAEQYAGLANGMLGTLRNGKKIYTDGLAARVRDALASDKPVPRNPTKEKTMAETPKLNTPETCPPILADLIRFKGSKAQAWRVLGTSEGTFYKAINGNGDVPPIWISRAKAAMGQPIIEAGPATPQVPEFVPWDGKLSPLILAPKPGHKKGRTIKVPEPIAKLYAMHGNISQMAKSMGHTSGALTAMLEDHKKFTDRWQRKFHAAIHGVSATPEAASDYDTYKLDLAIVMLKGGQNFDRVNELADALGGILAWKKNTKDGWMLIYSMRAETAAKFKRLAGRDASEIACP